MRYRCCKPTKSNYEFYGGRGIKVCERWMTFENFYEDMGDPPPGCTLDRIDTDGHYEPGNCRWATRKEQANNTRRNVLLTLAGRTQTLTQWSEEVGLKVGTLWSRVFIKKWSVEKSLTVPGTHKKQLTVDGRTMSMGEWARESGIPYKILHQRLRKGWTPERATKQ